MSELNDVVLLSVLEEKNLHVHAMPDDSAEIYRALKRPTGWSITDTHYIMEGSKVVFIGTIQGVKRFALPF